jgi:methyl-accepting chemotaxis protein
VEFHPMSPEEMQRTLQFLLAQQAQFATNLEKLTGQTDRIADAIVGLTGIVGHIAERQERTDQQIRETNTRVEQLGTRVDQLGDYIKSVESHLNVVIQMFERHLREDHGRRPS